MTKAEYVARLIETLADMGVYLNVENPKVLANKILIAQAKLMATTLREKGRVVLPGVCKFVVRTRPPQAARKGRDPSNGRIIQIGPKPISKQLTVKFMIDFRISTGAIKEKDKRVIAVREETKRKTQQLEQVRLDVISRLSPEELLALGLTKLPKPSR